VFWILSFTSCSKKAKKQILITKINKKTIKQEIKKEIKKNLAAVKSTNSLLVYLFNKEGNLKKVKLNIETKNLTLRDKLNSVLQCVQKPPREIRNYSSPLPAGVKIKQISQQGKICTINLNKSAIAYGGGISQETNFIAALVLTATQFKEIKKVQILIEGKKVKALPEGTEIFYPLQRKDFIASVDERK